MSPKIKAAIAATVLNIIGYTPLFILHGLGFILGTLLFILPLRPRYYAYRNMELCFTQLNWLQRQYLLWQSLRETCKGILELPVFFVRSQRYLLSLVRNKSVLETVQQDIAQNKGAIILGMHLGGYYLKNSVIAHYLPKTTYLYKPQKGTLQQELDKRLNRYGGNLVQTDREGVLALYRHLRAGGSVGMICDHNVLDNGNVWADFFGIAVPAMTLPAKLVSKARVPVYMANMQRLSWARGYRMHLRRIDENIYNPDIKIATEAMLQEVEQSVKQFPAQYEWLYRRFWDRPPGQPPLYKTQQ